MPKSLTISMLRKSNRHWISISNRFTTFETARRVCGPFLLVIALLSSYPVAEADTLTERNGRILYRSDGGSWVTLSSGPRDTYPTISPDGRTVAFVRSGTPSEEEGVGPETSLWLTDTNGIKERELISSHNSPEYSGIHLPTFSLNGGFIYFMAGEAATVSTIFQVNIKTGTVKSVTTGNSLVVIRTGKWAGYLLVRMHKYLESGGSRDPIVVVKPDGTEMFELPETDDPERSSADQWLKENDAVAW